MEDEQVKQQFIMYLANKYKALDANGQPDQAKLKKVIEQLGQQGIQQEEKEFMQLLNRQRVQQRKMGGKLNYIDHLRTNY